MWAQNGVKFVRISVIWVCDEKNTKYVWNGAHIFTTNFKNWAFLQKEPVFASGTKMCVVVHVMGCLLMTLVLQPYM